MHIRSQYVYREVMEVHLQFLNGVKTQTVRLEDEQMRYRPAELVSIFEWPIIGGGLGTGIGIGLKDAIMPAFLIFFMCDQ